MNKQELISLLMMEKISAEVKQKGIYYTKGYEKGIDLAIKLIEASDDEPQKPVLPKIVAEWLEMCKDENRQLRQSLNFMPFGANFWLSNSENQELFARAWLDGYVTDKEDRYTIKLIETRQYLHRRGNDFFFDAYVKPKDNPEIVFTRKDIEDAGLSWVFDCPGVEVQEVGLC